MIIHCHQCGKTVSNKLQNCPYCKKTFVHANQSNKKPFRFLQNIATSLRSLFF